MTTRNDLPGARRNREASRAGLLVLTLAALSGLAWAVGGCKSKTNAFAPPPPPEVTVAHPIHHPVTRYFEYTGSTEAFLSVELRARVTGFLEQVLFKPGAAVKKGDLLFVIDKRTFQAAVDNASAAVEQRAARLMAVSPRTSWMSATWWERRGSRRCWPTWSAGDRCTSRLTPVRVM